MIKYPKVRESTQRILTMLSQLYQLSVVDLDYSPSIKLYCEIIPQNEKHLKIKVWLTEEDQFLIYEDINGGLEHQQFVTDISQYLEVGGNLDLGELRLEKWDHESIKHDLTQKEVDNNCFSCQYRNPNGFCTLLNNYHPRKENNLACAYWDQRDGLVI